LEENLKLIEESQEEETKVRCYLRNENREYTDRKIVTEVKKIIANVKKKVET